MSYTYASYRAALQTLVVSQDPDVDFDNILPSAIDYAEQRIYRTLDLLDTVQRDYDTVLATADRNAKIADTFVVLNGINLFTPAGTDKDTGKRKPLIPGSRDVVDLLWPDTTVTGEPKIFAMIDQFNIIVGPSPDAPYALEVIGTYRPAPLSNDNPATFLSLHLPDLLIAASMVFMSGYMRNFSSSGNDPQMPVNWEQQTAALMDSANKEELRKQFWGDTWASLPPGAETSTRGK